MREGGKHAANTPGRTRRPSRARWERLSHAQAPPPRARLPPARAPLPSPPDADVPTLWLRGGVHAAARGREGAGRGKETPPRKGGRRGSSVGVVFASVKPRPARASLLSCPHTQHVLTHTKNQPKTQPPLFSHRPGKRCFVGNLAWRTSWQDLKDKFREAGTVVYANVMRDDSGECGRLRACFFWSKNGAVFFFSPTPPPPAHPPHQAAPKAGASSSSSPSMKPCRPSLRSTAWSWRVASCW